MRFVKFNIDSGSKVGDSVSSVEGGPNLLIGTDEPVKFGVEVLVLAVEDFDVILERVNFPS